MLSFANRRLSLAIAALLLVASAGAAAPGDAAASAPDVVTLEKIMSDPDWIGSLPEDPAWADDGRSVFFERKRRGESVRDLYEVPVGGGEAKLVDDAERSRKAYGAGDWSEDRSRKVFTREGDVFVNDLGRSTLSALTRTNEEESDAFFLVGDRQVAFRRGDGWFVRELESGVEWQAADLRLAKDPAEEAVEKTFLEEQEQRLFEVLREGERREKTARRVEKERQQQDPLRPRLPWYLGEKVEIQDSLLSPTGDFLLVVFGDEEDESKRDQMPKWITKTALVETDKLRPHVGDQVVKTPRLALLDLRKHVRHDLDLTTLPGISEDPLAKLREAAEQARKEREKRREAAAKLERGEAAVAESATTDAAAAKGARPGKPVRGKAAKPEPEKPEPKPRAVEVDGLEWSDDGAWVVFQAFSADNKERWIVGVDAAAGKLIPLERITDPAWINWSFRDLGWLPRSRTLWYLSEESGYSQLYLRPVDGTKRQLTSGKFEIRGAFDDDPPAVARDGKSFVVVANREHSGIWEAYRVSVETGELTRLSTVGGENEVLVSPDESSLLLTHGRATRPPELYVQAAASGAAARQLTESRTPEFAAVSWSEPQYVTIPPKHGQAPIPARLFMPATAGPRPAVLFIHGAGYLQNADQGWSSYFREFMFHSLLARSGYVVLDMDFRASAGYGRDWRTAIYRQMGTPELEDITDGIDWLVAEHGVDRARVGAYGGSYGGFLTLMALFRQPGLLAAGAALRPVTDWAHYNHPYTSNILNTPEVDPEAYARSSPIEFAAGLARPLLICHGMVDDNVVFQDSVRLVQRLIELKKESFETAIYPFEPHGFKEPTSWLDEYRRIFNLFERHVGGAQACSG